jgi:hypothetical protein
VNKNAVTDNQLASLRVFVDVVILGIRPRRFGITNLTSLLVPSVDDFALKRSK